MAVDCAACPLRAKTAFLPFTADELAFMQRFKTAETVVSPGAYVLHQGQRSDRLYTVLAGTGLRSRLTPDGARQVVNLILPGDFIGLQAAVMDEMGHSAQAVTELRLCVFDRAGLWQLFEHHPERAYALTRLATMEEHFLGDALATVGQKPALERVAWGLARYYQRCDALGLVRNGRCALPVRQQDLADALGLSIVHTNKTLARLRITGVLTWKDGWLVLHDRQSLSDLVGWDIRPADPRPLI